MITVYRWCQESRCGEWLGPDVLLKEADAIKKSPDVVWIDLENPSPEEEKLIFDTFYRIHPLTLEDVTRPRRHPESPPHLPKVEEFPDYLFVVVNPLTQGVLDGSKVHAEDPGFLEGGLVTQLSAVLTHTLLVTHHYEIIPSVTDLRSYLTKHDAQAERGPDFLFHLILDDMVDEYAPVLDHLTDTLDEHETAIFRQPAQETLEELMGLKRSTMNLRKTLVHEREILARLCRGEFKLIDDRETVYYRNVYDHLMRFTELIEAAREMVSDLMQTHLASMGNRLNQIMKTLTMISTIVLPMSVIAGIYGMNFQKNIWPSFTDSEWGFWFALLLMVGTGVLGYLFFKWKRWG